MADRTCSVEGCERKHKARGWCYAHWKRWWNHGTVEPTPVRGYKGDNPAYVSAHLRVRRSRGPASDHICVDCGKQAREWSYVYGCAQEMRDDRGCPYCPHPEHYAPRCSSCHKVFDLAR